MSSRKIIILFFMFTACSKATEVVMPKEESVLVINAQWRQNQNPIARISRTRSINEPIDTSAQKVLYQINNAFVLAYENGILWDTLFYDAANLRYISTKKRTKNNALYKLRVSASGYSSVDADNFLPAVMAIRGMVVERNFKKNEVGVWQDRIKFFIDDIGAVANYYLIRIRKNDNTFISCVVSPDADITREVSGNPLSTQSCLSGDRILLSDINFNGKTKTVELFVESAQLVNATLSGNIKRPYVELLHITKDYYQYMLSIKNYDNANDNPFAEPYNVYTNVKNGYGLFTTFHYAVDTIR